ncbi:SDR family NAD(P)-dependent oxidoreductase [Candidatus Woesearchaeota archaeon]|nr:SDR family NAD(P)-dependent oxidoreductase [Candidatus Woesearchaeota archaeon]
MKMLVTGGAGFIGSHLVKELLEAGNTVVVLDNLHRDMNLVKDMDIRFIEGDIRDYETCLKATEGAEIVFHLAAQSNVIGSAADPDYSFSTNIDGTYNVLKACVEQKVRKLVFSSSREVYGDAQYTPVDEKHPIDPKNIYGATKVSGEVLCSSFAGNFDIDIAIGRIANVYGPGDKDRVIPIFLDNCFSGKDLEVYGGSQVLDFVWVRDVVKALIEMMKDDYDGKTINIGSGKGITVLDLAKLVKKLTGSRSDIKVKEKRDIEVQGYVSSTDNMPIKPVELEKGLKMLIQDMKKNKIQR